MNRIGNKHLTAVDYKCRRCGRNLPLQEPPTAHGCTTERRDYPEIAWREAVFSADKLMSCISTELSAESRALVRQWILANREGLNLNLQYEWTKP